MPAPAVPTSVYLTGSLLLLAVLFFLVLLLSRLDNAPEAHMFSLAASVAVLFGSAVLMWTVWKDAAAIGGSHAYTILALLAFAVVTACIQTANDYFGAIQNDLARDYTEQSTENRDRTLRFCSWIEKSMGAQGAAGPSELETAAARKIQEGLCTVGASGTLRLALADRSASASSFVWLMLSAGAFVGAFVYLILRSRVRERFASPFARAAVAAPPAGASTASGQMERPAYDRTTQPGAKMYTLNNQLFSLYSSIKEDRERGVEVDTERLGALRALLSKTTGRKTLLELYAENPDDGAVRARLGRALEASGFSDQQIRASLDVGVQMSPVGEAAGTLYQTLSPSSRTNKTLDTVLHGSKKDDTSRRLMETPAPFGAAPSSRAVHLLNQMASLEEMEDEEEDEAQQGADGRPHPSAAPGIAQVLNAAAFSTPRPSGQPFRPKK